MAITIVVVAAVVVATYLAYDWRSSSRLKRELASGVAGAPGTPQPRGRHRGTNLDSHVAASNGIRNSSAGFP